MKLPGIVEKGFWGRSVALSHDGNIALIGADGVNSVSVLSRNNGAWVQTNVLTPQDAAGVSKFGFSVALSAQGGVALIGGPSDDSNRGAVWVYLRSGSEWIEQAKLIPVNAGPIALAGYSVGISADGNTAILGAPTASDGQGRVWVFSRQGNQWVQQAVLDANDAQPAQRGFAVAVSGDGNVAAVGGPYDAGENGAVWLYSRTGDTWSVAQKLVPSVSGARFGAALALSADAHTVLVGLPNAHQMIGDAWVYAGRTGAWALQGMLSGAGSQGTAHQGTNVALSADGNTALAGGPGDTRGANSGSVWAWTLNGGVWLQAGGKFSGSAGVGAEAQGSAIAIAGDSLTALIGGSGDDSGRGSVWPFVRDTGSVSDGLATSVSALADYVPAGDFPAGLQLSVSATGEVLLARADQYATDPNGFITRGPSPGTPAYQRFSDANTAGTPPSVGVRKFDGRFPFGALIGTWGVKNSDIPGPESFLIGSSSEFTVPDIGGSGNARLYLTVNDSARNDDGGGFSVAVSDRFATAPYVSPIVATPAVLTLNDRGGAPVTSAITSIGGSLPIFLEMPAPSWLVASLSSATTPATLSIFVAPGTAAGTYSTVLNIRSTGASMPVPVTVNATVTIGGASLQITRVPGEATDIGAGSDGSAFIIGTRPCDASGCNVYKFGSGQWQAYPGTAVRIAVDPGGNP